MNINEKKVKGIVTRSKLPDADFVVNPYTGCQHGCDYCYAKFMKRFSDAEGEWGEFVEVKVNAEEVFEERKYSGKTVLFSSVTDPYHPVESEYKLSRRLLKKFIGSEANVEILTKSALVKRDVDIFEELNDVQVAVSLASLDENISRKLEPLASSPKARLDALEHIHNCGIKTYVFISPILPFVSNVEEMVQEIEDRGCADRYLFENLNITSTLWPKMRDFLEENFPELVGDYQDIYFGEKQYWEEKNNDIESLCAEYDFDYKLYTH